MTVRRQLVALLLLGLLAVLWPNAASAQTGLSLQLHGGGVVPLSAVERSVVRVDDETTEADQLATRLVDQFNEPGFQFGVTFLLNQIELRYTFQRFSWDREDTICSGTGSGVELATGEIDDSLVEYTCFDEGEVVSRSLAGLNPMLMHVISAGYRLYFLDAGRWNPYFVGAVGLAISSHNPDRAEDGVALGADLAPGFGLDVHVDGRVSIGLEARYHLLLSGPPARTQAAANRAIARDRSSAQTVLSAFHYVSLGLGIHFSFR